MPVITISRQMCSRGDEIAEALACRLGWDLITRNDLFSRFPDLAPSAYDRNMLAESAKHYLKQSRNGGTFLDVLKCELTSYLAKNPAILVGFGAQVICAGMTDALHIRIVADRDTRLARAKQQYRVSDEEAARILDTADKKHRKFVATVFGVELSEQSLYHLTLNTALLSVEDSADTVLALYRARTPDDAGERSELPEQPAERPWLKNQSESEFAKILDMYQIDWEYEPTTFPIEWDAEGNVTMAFRPDFYLKKFNTYIELTTMDQRYVTAKNKKVRKLRELYPGTNIKVVYRKDYHALVERFKLGSSVS